MEELKRDQHNLWLLYIYLDILNIDLEVLNEIIVRIILDHLSNEDILLILKNLIKYDNIFDDNNKSTKYIIKHLLKNVILEDYDDIDNINADKVGLILLNKEKIELYRFDNATHNFELINTTDEKYQDYENYFVARDKNLLKDIIIYYAEKDNYIQLSKRRMNKNERGSKATKKDLIEILENYSNNTSINELKITPDRKLQENFLIVYVDIIGRYLDFINRDGEADNLYFLSKTEAFLNKKNNN